VTALLGEFFVFGRSVNWYYWVAPILVVSFIGLIAALWGGYIRKVLIPKYRGKRVEE